MNSLGIEGINKSIDRHSILANKKGTFQLLHEAMVVVTVGKILIAIKPVVP